MNRESQLAGPWGDHTKDQTKEETKEERTKRIKKDKKGSKGSKRIKKSIKKDHKDQKDQKDHKDQKDQKGGKDQKDQKDQKDPAVHGAERIKKDQPHPPSDVSLEAHPGNCAGTSPCALGWSVGFAAGLGCLHIRPA